MRFAHFLKMLPTILFAFLSLGGPAASLPSLLERQSAWPLCQTSLSCTFWDIESASMQARLDYVRSMQTDNFKPLNASTRFRAIEGVIQFFLSKHLGQPGSWVSHVDAGIIEGIQSGAASTLGLSVPISAPPANDNPGIAVWAKYFAGQRISGGYSTRKAHDSAWGEAEATSTEWAKEEVADVVARPPATRKELNWYEFTKLFRWIMRNEDLTILLLRPIFLTKADDLVYWLTDTTRAEPALCGSQAAWAFAGTLTFDLEGVVTLPANVISLLQSIYDCGKDFIGEQ